MDTPRFVPRMISDTLSLLAFVGAGVLGVDMEFRGATDTSLEFTHRGNGGVSFGDFTVASRWEPSLFKHEEGHARQYDQLGALYYPLVAIPSAVRAVRQMRGKMSVNEYYEGYPENWANLLGGVR